LCRRALAGAATFILLPALAGAQEATAMPPPMIDTGTTAWMLVSTGLVLLINGTKLRYKML